MKSSRANQKRMAGVLSILTILFSLSLSGCIGLILLEADTTLKLGSGENWTLTTILVLPAEAGAFSTQIQSSLGEMIVEMEANGIKASWEILAGDEDDFLRYQVEFNGTSYQQLNQHIFEGANALQSVETEEGTQILFRVNAANVLGEALVQNFTLTGRRVIESNGVEVDSNTVVWTDVVGTMEAVLEPSSPLDLLAIGLILVGLVIIAFSGWRILESRRPAKIRADGAGYALPQPSAAAMPLPSKPAAPSISSPSTQPETHREQQSTAPVAPVSSPEITPPESVTRAQFCHHCGSQLKAEAEFCPSCGTPRKKLQN